MGREKTNVRPAPRERDREAAVRTAQANADPALNPAAPGLAAPTGAVNDARLAAAAEAQAPVVAAQDVKNRTPKEVRKFNAKNAALPPEAASVAAQFAASRREKDGAGLWNEVPVQPRQRRGR